MKPSTVFLAELTNSELETFLEKNNTVLIPVGATEQHGPAGPLGTDTLVPLEIAKRLCGSIGAVVAPPVNYALSQAHRGFTGEFSLSINTFIKVIEDLCIAFNDAGFRRIIFLNGHYDNTHGIAFGCANAADKLSDGCRAYPVGYWEGFTPDIGGRYFGGKKGLHANAAEISAVLAINPDLVDMKVANVEEPNFPETKTGSPAIHTAFFQTNPGSVWKITESGTWGDAANADAESGRTFLNEAVKATLALIDDIEATFDQLPKRIK
jgi:creatinine amidohydrolase